MENSPNQMSPIDASSSFEAPKTVESQSVGTEQITAFKTAIIAELERQNLKPEDVVFSGYNSSVSKPEEGEHGSRYFFGNWDSLSYEEADGTDDIAGERWVVNPLHYAMQGGTLGIHSKEGIARQGNLDLFHNPEYDQEFGTLSFDVENPSDLDSTRIATIDVNEVLVDPEVSDPSDYVESISDFESSLQLIDNVCSKYGLDGKTSIDRAKQVKTFDPAKLALFLTEINMVARESSYTAVHERAVTIGGEEAVQPEDRYDVFIDFVQSIQDSPEDINPDRIGDAIALAVVMTHPFKDGNGRTARIASQIFRDDFDPGNSYKLTNFTALAESRDKIRKTGGFNVNGYIPNIDVVKVGDTDSIKKFLKSVLRDEKVTYSTPWQGVPNLRVAANL